MKIIDRFFGLLFPRRIKCAVCGKDTPDGRLCEGCRAEHALYSAHRCKRCDRAIFGEGDYCLLCKDNDYSFERVLSAFDFKENIAGLVHSFKFGNKRYLSSFFAAEMADRYRELGIKADCLVAVPMTEKAIKKRGYNQASLLATEISNRIGVPLSENLVKLRDTEEQAQLGYNERQKNLDRVFAVPDKREFSGKRVVLIDDVYTTGATANECSRVMLKAGALEVYVLVAATRPQSKVTAKDKKRKRIE